LCDKVFVVVQNQQRRLARKDFHDLLQRFQSRRTRQAESVQDGSRYPLGLRKVGQRDKPDGSVEGIGQPAGDLNGKPRLPAAARPGQGEQAKGGERRQQVLQTRSLLPATKEACEGERQLRGRKAWTEGGGGRRSLLLLTGGGG